MSAPSVAPGDLLSPGRIIDGLYQIERELGRGSTGVVLLARELKLDRLVALKVQTPGQRTAEARAAFLREAAALSSVRHDNIVQVYAQRDSDDFTYFAIEYVEGATLGRIIADHREHGARVPISRATTVLAQVAEGLAAIHAAGLAHRDIKPDNIVIEAVTGRPVVVDFGFAHELGSGPDTEAVGTPLYMAPELIAQRPHVDLSRSDQYSWAVTAFELLTGALPFTGARPVEVFLQHLRAQPPLPSALFAELTAFDQLLSRALSKEPTARFESCAAAATALRAAEHLATSAGNHRGLSSPSLRAPRLDIDTDDVLVVDDDVIFRKMATRAAQIAFSRHPLRVGSAASGPEALERIQTPPRLLLLDYDMPGLDGIETLTLLRDLPGGYTTRVVVISARLGPEERWRFSVLGVEDFIAKPIELAQLVEQLDLLSEGGKVSRSRRSPPPEPLL